MTWNKLISSEKEYEAALKRLSEIFDAYPDSSKGMEAELLVTLIEKYETENSPISFPDPIEAIKDMMENKGLKDKDLIPALGSKSAVSHILNKNRTLTKDMIRNLSQLLEIPVAVLIQPYSLKIGEEV